MGDPRPEAILWLTVQRGEFYNIERAPQIDSGRSKGGGAQYFEIPGSLVPAAFKLLQYTGSYANFPVPYEIQASAVGRPDLVGPIRFNKKSESSGVRLYIVLQNRQATGSIRHPAWSPSVGFPQAPDDIQEGEGKRYLPAGNLRIYIIRLDNGEFQAGFTTGFVPPELEADDPNRLLFVQKRGDLIEFDKAGNVL